MGRKVKVVLEPLGQETEVDVGRTLLKGLLQQGWMVPHGCSHGDCGRCKARVSEGKVRLAPQYSRFALPDWERDEGYVLVCQAYAESPLVLEYEEPETPEYHPERRVQVVRARIERKRWVAPDLCEVTFALDSTLRCLPGQYVDVSIPGTDETRSYSVCGQDDAGRAIQVVVRKSFHGLGSTWLCDFAAPGDITQVEGPMGTAYYRPSAARRIVLVAGGSGIGMIKAIAEAALHGQRPVPIAVYYGARRPEDFAYGPEFAALEQTYPHFQVRRAVSDPVPEAVWSGARGLIAEVLDADVSDFRDCDVYVAGPPPMVAAVREVVARKGASPDRVYYDEFLELASNRYGYLRRAADAALGTWSAARRHFLVVAQVESGEAVIVRRYDAGAEVIPSTCLPEGGRQRVGPGGATGGSTAGAKPAGEPIDSPGAARHANAVPYTVQRDMPLPGLVLIERAAVLPAGHPQVTLATVAYRDQFTEETAALRSAWLGEGAERLRQALLQGWVYRGVPAPVEQTTSGGS